MLSMAGRVSQHVVSSLSCTSLSTTRLVRPHPLKKIYFNTSNLFKFVYAYFGERSIFIKCVKVKMFLSVKKLKI